MRPTSVASVAVSLLLVVFTPASSQQPAADPAIDAAVRSSVIERLSSKIENDYVIPETARSAVQSLRNAQNAGAYESFGTAGKFAEKLTSDLRLATHDKHIAVYFEPEAPTQNASSAPLGKSREHFNFGFNKVERLKGNVGYLDLRSFANLDEGRDTASTYLAALANFDSIILDLRQNGGGNTPMVAYIASYFFDTKPVHLTDMYWRDRKQTIEVWTLESVPGRRSVGQDLFVLVGPSTFSAAEDFSYSLQQLKRATLVGEITGGGAHMGRGLQRLTPLFTAFIPVGQSLNPLTMTNWENIGVQPDINVSADKALTEAHLTALRRLVERESDPAWQNELRRAIGDLAAGK